MNVKDFIIKHEGISLKPYYCPAGKLSIGVGRNLQDNGITYDEVVYLLENDIDRCIRELKEIFKDFNELPENIQIALIDMIFNLGKTRFLQFQNLIQAVKDRDFQKASEEAKDSRWCKQVGKRCDDVMEMFIVKHIEKK
jgi:lysozyme